MAWGEATSSQPENDGKSVAEDAGDMMKTSCWGTLPVLPRGEILWEPAVSRLLGLHMDAYGLGKLQRPHWDLTIGDG